jgi:hypothetical protein
MFTVLLAATLLTADPEKLDVSSRKATMRVYSDGKKHYLVTAFEEGQPTPEYSWYGDGKSFYRVRTPGGGGSRDKWNIGMWEPRFPWGHAGIEYNEGELKVSCGDRSTALTQLKGPETKALVDGAQFFNFRWTRQPYLLARDDKGTYYFVDMQRDVIGKKDMKLYIGQRGSLKPQQMTNIVSDSVGDIFSTKTGELRLVANGDEMKWVQGKAEAKLTKVPVDDNAMLIYTDLGVYERMPLGTPCDDF